MSFHSILFLTADEAYETTPQPECFRDLHLDQVIEALTASRLEYDLKPFFYFSLQDADAVAYRHEILRDLEQPNLQLAVRTFTSQLAQVRRILANLEKMDYPYHRKGWYLEAVLLYDQSVRTFAAELQTCMVTSHGFQALQNWLNAYIQSPSFLALGEEAVAVKKQLRTVTYDIIIQSGKFGVKRYEDEADYTPQIEQTFARFRQGDVKEYLASLPESSDMNHIEAQILDFVSRLYPEPFHALDRFCERFPQFFEETLRRFEREVQFYLAWLDFTVDLKAQGLPFCYPEIVTDRTSYGHDCFDLALAHRLRYSDRRLVLNDFALSGPERVLVVTGPNQGGKTTFARMIGQIHYLATLGLPVPGRQVRLSLCDRIFTHFERVEDVRNQRGKLQDDLVRIHEILTHATPHSLIILNEIFASTTLQDALFLSREILQRLLNLDSCGVWVTFLDELASFSEKTVSMVSTIVPETTERTFKIVRRPSEGLAYALSLAEKHGLTFERLKDRIRP